MNHLVRFVFCALLITQLGAASAQVQIRRAANSYDREGFTSPGQATRVKASGTLAGRPGESAVNGWVEYDVGIPRSGWYEFVVLGKSGRETEYIFEPQLHASNKGGIYIYSSNEQIVDNTDKISNVWLDQGQRTLRIQRFHWTGFPAIEGFILVPSGSAAAKSIRLTLPTPANHFRVDHCAPIEVLSGDRLMPTTITLTFFDSMGTLKHSEKFLIPASKEVHRQSVPVYCGSEGEFRVEIAEGSSGISARDHRPIRYQVVETRRSDSIVGEPRKQLLQEIDCTTAVPSFSGGGATRIRQASFGPYRESGDIGYTAWQRVPDSARRLLPEPSWFAYTLDRVRAGQLHAIEFDFPDDDYRSFTFALREAAPLSYPVAGGVDTGGEFSLSSGLQTQSLLFWPRSDAPRATFMNVHNGRRSACAKIRAYRIEEPLPALLADPHPIKREFLNWYEEGNNFLSMYGARDTWNPGALREAANRWASAVRHIGGTTLVPTALVYEFAMYPSRYNLLFSRPDQDLLRLVMLAAEKNGLGVIPELHPRADELDFPFSAVPDPKPNLLADKNGRTSFHEGSGPARNHPPAFNPLHPGNRRWYLDMIGELADRYKDSPAFRGVSLRLMSWKNPSLNNFQSLDWGYDDLTVEMFKRETGMKVPGPMPSPDGRITREIASTRYKWIMANARQEWIDWRCRKITELYVEVRDRVRQSRADLKVFSTISNTENLAAAATHWRNGGIDSALLSKIDGVVLINSTIVYGRREAEQAPNQRERDGLLDPNSLAAFNVGSHSAHLSYARYLEATEAIVPPVQLGFPAETRTTWTSGVSNAPGRQFLERFALPLAESDATILGDGGNGYSLGQPLLREFLREYRALPLERFNLRLEARDPVAVWTLQLGSAYWFYAVNRERYPIELMIRFDQASEIIRPSTNARVEFRNNTIRVQLQPFELQVFRGSQLTRIVRVETLVPPIERARVQAQVGWIEASAKGSLANMLILTDAQKQLLRLAAAEARSALAEGRLWRARTLLERFDLQEIYARLGSAPPRLRDPEDR